MSSVKLLVFTLLVGAFLAQARVIQIDATSPQVDPTDAPSLPEIQCKTQSIGDIVFLVDQSGSIGHHNFEIMKMFMVKMVRSFPVGIDNIRIGLVKYSTKPHTEFQLNTYSTKQEVIQAIMRMSYSKGDTLTGRALTHVQENIFQPQSGSRVGVPKILMLFTDGKSQDAVVSPAQKLKDTGVEIFTIGVKDADKVELDRIATLPLDTHVYIVPNFPALDNILERLTQTVCESVDVPVVPTDAPSLPVIPTDAPSLPVIPTDAPSLPVIPTDAPSLPDDSPNAMLSPEVTVIDATSPEDDSPNASPEDDLTNAKSQPEIQCKTQSTGDIVFLVDQSGSIGDENFQIMKLFLVKMVQSFPVGVDNIRIGLVKYSTKPHTEFQLNTYSTKQEVIEVIERMSYDGGSTYTGQALTYVQENSFQPQSGSRVGVRKILMLLTDGKSQDKVVSESQKLKDTGVEIFTIGVQSADKAELDSIATLPLDTHVYIVPNFPSLDNIVEHLTKTVCESVDVPDTTPCCPAGWTRFSEHNHDDCYLSITSGKTWAEAESYCQFEGGHLASIHSQETNHFLKNLTKSAYNFPLTWVGGHNIVQSCLWMWSDGSSFDYENWYNENNRDRENSCLCINYGCNLNKLKWSSSSCKDILPFVCAKKSSCRDQCLH